MSGIQEQGAIHRIAPLISNDIFELILLPTEECNFRCSYCYEEFRPGKMTPEVVDGVKKLIASRASIAKHLILSWFGGEPLLAKDVVLDISRIAFDISRATPNLKYTGVMTTNGFLLTRTVLSELVAAGVTSFQITLDGPRDVHNGRRLRYKSSVGTFDRIWKNLIQIRDSGLPVSVTLRVHFDASSYNLLDPLIDDIQHELVPSGIFTVFIRELSRLGGTNDENISVCSEDDKQKVLNRLYDKLGVAPFQRHLENYVCYASRPNSLVIRSDGTISKCTVAFRDERNDLGKIDCGGKLNIDSERLGLWLRGFETMSPNELECPLRELPDRHTKLVRDAAQPPY